jgi:hypothetical protein
MTGSTPDDLAIAFRSLARRVKEALAPVDGDTRVAAEQLKQLERVVASAAAQVRSGTSATEVADAIAGRRGDSWTDDELDALRKLALEAGKILRLIETAASGAASGR